MMFLLTLATEDQECIIEHIVYTSDQLISQCKPALLYEAALLTGGTVEETPGLQSWSETEGEEEREFSREQD